MKQKVTIFTLLKIGFLLILLAITVYPFIYMVSISLSDKTYVLRNEIFFLPKGLNFEMYYYVLTDSRIFTAYGNTIMYVLSGTLISLAITSTGSYALSKDNMMFKSFFVKLLIICLFFNGGMIPTYLIVKNLKLLDSIWAVVLPGAVSIWNFIVMMSLFSNVPKELEDSSKIDGVGEFGAFWYIALPLSKAALATIGLFYAVSIWNEFTGPLIYLSSPKKFPLTVILRDMIIAGSDLANRGQASDDGGYVVVDSLKYATLVVSVFPIMCVYPFLQKYFVKGVLVGSIKG